MRAAFLAFVIVVEAQFPACSTSSQCQQNTCCLYNGNTGRRLLAPLGPGWQGGQGGQCVAMGQAGSPCYLNAQEPYSVACPCAPGLTCTASQSLGGNAVGTCTIYLGGACSLDVYTCPDGRVVSRVPPQCDFTPCVAGPGGIVGPGMCSYDVQTCPSGRVVSRVPPACEFAPCDGGNSLVCSTDTIVCPNGQSVGRLPPYCTFAPCGDGGVVCPADVQQCPNSGYSVRRVPPSCTFASCNPINTAPGTCALGQIMCDTAMQSRGIQCPLNTCVSITPCYNHSMCGVGYYCYSCFRCRFDQGCLLTAACAANPVLGDCSAVTNCLREQNAINGVCPWGNNTCTAVTCPSGQVCQPGASNYWSGTPQYTCVYSSSVFFTPSMLLISSCLLLSLAGVFL